MLTAQHRDVVWVCANAALRLLGRADLVVAPGEPLLPVTERIWCAIEEDALVSAVFTPTAHVTERLWPALDRFSTRVLEFARLGDAEEADAIQRRRREAWESERSTVAAALQGFSRILSPPSRRPALDGSRRTSLQEAVFLVAESCGARLETPPGPENDDAGAETVQELAARSGLRTRRIRLTGNWWRRAGPSLIGFRSGTQGREPLALLSDDKGSYRAVAPETGAAFPVDRTTAAGIAPDAVMLYAPLPDRVESGADVIRFALHKRGRDIRVMLAMGVLGGLAALVTPILTGQILVEIIPRADASLWLAAFAALLVAAFGNAVFEIVRALAFLRIESRMDERLQAALWSRLLSLPASFFRRFTAGDLANRANGVATARQSLTGAAVQGAMGAIFSVFSLALLFYYSATLALLVVAMLLSLALTSWLLSLGQLRHFRVALRVQGELNGFVFQMISGLAKLRVANSTRHALARWAERYAEQKAAGLAALRWSAGQQVLNSMFQPLSLVVVFAAVHHLLAQDGTTFDLPAFLSFHAAFGQLAGAVTSLATAATTLVSIVPHLERVRPILEAEPESARGGVDPGDLKGDIEFDNVSFRYAADRPNAVSGVSFRIRQGDYVAFVGPSGCGKSTLYRLLLGFETPDSGTVFLDGHSLTSLDPRQVRKRMGVVLQHGQIVAGSILENIAGMSPVTEEEAWAAVRAAALEDDIRAMPMGLRTVLPEGGTGLSVGQKQRLRIARALARRPRVLLFDEATSALDNRAQAKVQDALGAMSITRVVIAHRLSTIRDVDRIHVLDAGRIVENGTYEQLVQRDGVFAALARRQLVEG